MAKSETTASSGGVGLAGLVFIVFLVLKLTETGAVATWSWWWVTSPLWLPLGIVLAVAGVIFTVFGVASLFDGSRNRWKRM